MREEINIGESFFGVVEPWQRINQHNCSPTESLASFPGFARRTWDRGYGLPSLCGILEAT